MALQIAPSLWADVGVPAKAAVSQADQILANPGDVTATLDLGSPAHEQGWVLVRVKTVSQVGGDILALEGAQDSAFATNRAVIATFFLSPANVEHFLCARWFHNAGARFFRLRLELASRGSPSYTVDCQVISVAGIT